MEKKKYISLSINTQDYDKSYYSKNGKKYYKSFLEQKQHNDRTEEIEKGYLLNEDLTQYNQNYINPKYKTKEQIDEQIEKGNQDYKDYYKKKLPSNTKSLINGLITFSDTFQVDLYDYGIDLVFKHIQDFLKEEFGEIISIDLHLDETTPHFHFSCFNYDFKEHKTISQKMKKSISEDSNVKQNFIQDRVATYLQEKIKDFDYERGEVRSIKVYHSERTKQQEHLKKQQQQIKDYKEEIKQLKKDKEDLQSNITKLEEKTLSLIENIENLHNDKISIIKNIINDLEDLKDTQEVESFIKKVQRYVKSDNQVKLDKLLNKYQKGLSNVKNKKNNQLNTLKPKGL